MNHKIRRKGMIPFILILLVVAAPLKAQNVLDDYVQEGLKSNLVLQQKNLTLQQAQQSLQMARSYFLPTVSLLADYTSGQGGRSIALPVGDLLNPVYATLNQMTQSDKFPQIENVNQNFFPKNFYDAKVRTSLPLINTDIHINQKIQGQQVMLKQYEVDAYRRELVMEIKTAYYNVRAAEMAEKIYESALLLVNKNVEVNKSLLRNGKSLPAYVLRSKSEAEKVKADLNNARNKKENAKRYFNFLLNKPLDEEVITETKDDNISLNDVTDASGNIREELQMLKTAQAINESSVQLYKLNRVPKLSAFLDLGSQAYDWKYNSDSKYYLVGVQFNLPLFQGFRNNVNIKQRNVEIRKTALDLEKTTQQLELAVSVAQNDLQTSIENFKASEEQLRAAQNYFHLIDKGYLEGINPLIEFLDARNQLTASELQYNLRKFEVLTAQARLERETASYSF